MKKLGLLALLLAAAPLAATAQFVIFTDNFTNGSTLNGTSTPGGTPFKSFTSYDILASKAATTGPTLTNGEFRLQLNASTSSGLLDTEAVFTRNPITLVNVGDSITLSYTFRMTNALPTASAFLAQGLYNSGGTVPVPGSLNNSGLGTANFVTGNAQLWQGIFSRFFNGAASVALLRPPQTNNPTTSASQDLTSPSSVTGGFNAPAAVALSGNLPSQAITLANGQYYNITMTVSLGDTNTEAGTQTLNITNTLSDLQGNVIGTFASTATGANYMTTFDALSLGRRETGSILVTMVVTNITITANLSTLPGQPFNVTGGGQGCAGNTFPVGLNGSVTTNDYYLYTNGVWNGMVQTGTGSALSFGNETVISVPLTNTVFASNTVSGATGLMLGSAVVSPNPPPAISSQPIPVIAANGSIAVFSVAATGGGLTYQWFKNGAPLSDNSHISGSANSTLVISPVGPGDAASTAQGYYALITSGCGAQLATATNSLTVQPGASIVWQGNNPNSNWDLSTTANFTNGSTPVVFHNGDFVTLDDTALTPLINIANNYLAPSAITNNAFTSFILSGSGVIQGPGSFVMNGPGTTSINNSNAFLGGASINGGTLIMSNQYALGPSTITLSGGTLDMQVSFGSAAGLSNNINTISNSTFQVEKTGTFGLVVDGALTGSSTATLTMNLNNGNATSSRVRMYDSFTNNANMVLNSLGALVEMAPYLGSNDQVFNGVISGTFGRFTPRGAGNVIFGNTNTFNDTGVFAAAGALSGYSLVMSSGNAGFGADSVSTTPPTIDASPAGTGKIAINVGSESGTDTLFAYGAAHTVGNVIDYTSTSNTVTLILGGTNNLTLSGAVNLALSSVDTVGTNRTLQVTNTAATTFSGVITDNGIASGIIKTGTGKLFLNGANNYTGTTTVSNGVLAGIGSIAGPVDVEGTGAIGGGSAAAIGALTINNSLTLNGGAYIRVDKTQSPSRSNDVISVSGTLSGGAGTITVTNIGATALNVGDKFQIFNKAVSGGGAFTIVGGGVNWNNNLLVDGSISVASIATGPATNPTNMTFSVSGGNLTISWPADHLGWYLQQNTNSLTSNTWVDVAGSNTGTNAVIPINTANRNAFYRMSLNP